MRSITAGVGVLAIAAIAACGDDDNGTGVELEFFDAFLIGDEEVPPVETDAAAQANFATDGTTVDYEILVADIVEVTAAHIHEGEVGENGPILRTLFTAEPPETPPTDTAQIVLDTFVAPDDDVDMTLDELLDLMRSGGAYVNVHTAANLSGEIRGQIAPFE